MLNNKRAVIAIIQARLGASRLPGKVLLELLPGKTVIDCVVARVKRAQVVDKVVVATTTNPQDNQLIEHLQNANYNFFVGDENDVLDRYYQTALKYCKNADDVIVRITADCPVIDPENIDKLIGIFLNNDYDFVSNTLEPYSWPDGMDVEIFSFVNLKKAWQEAKLPSHREHVTFYFWQNPQVFKIYYDKNDQNLSNYRLTLDYKEDYVLLKKIYEHFGSLKVDDFNMDDIIEFLDANPAIKAINSEAKRNAGWQSALKKDMKIFLPDNFSRSDIRFKPVVVDRLFISSILDKYFSNCKIIDVLDIDTTAISSKNYRVIVAVDGVQRDVLFRKYNFLKPDRILFYSELLCDLARRNLPVSKPLKTLDEKFMATVGDENYALFDFIGGNYFFPNIESFLSVARAIARMHKVFSAIDQSTVDKINTLSQQGYIYYNKVKTYSVADFESIKEIINNRTEKSDNDLYVLKQLPLISEAVNEVENKREMIDSLPVGLIHSDLHPHNLLMKDNDVRAILDFDGMRVSQRARDVAFAIYRLGRQFFANNLLPSEEAKAKELVNLFVTEYEKVNPLSREEKSLLPILLKDEFLKKILFVLNGIYKEDNHTWAKDLHKFLGSIEEINFFWNQSL